MLQTPFIIASQIVLYQRLRLIDNVTIKSALRAYLNKPITGLSTNIHQISRDDIDYCQHTLSNALRNVYAGQYMTGNYILSIIL